MSGVRYEASCPCGYCNRAYGFGVDGPLVCPDCHKKTLHVEPIDDPFDGVARPHGSDGDRANHPHREHEK